MKQEGTESKMKLQYDLTMKKNQSHSQSPMQDRNLKTMNTRILSNKSEQLPIVSYNQLSNYKLNSKPIGEGAVGQIFQVIHKTTQELYALKRVSVQKAEMVSASYL